MSDLYSPIAMYFYLAYDDAFSFNITASYSNVNIKPLATAAGWNGSQKLRARFVGSSQYINQINLTQSGVASWYPNGLEIYIGSGCFVSGSGTRIDAIQGSAASFTPGYPIKTAIAVSIENDGIIAAPGAQGGKGGDIWCINSRDNQEDLAYGGNGGRGDTFMLAGSTENGSNVTRYGWSSGDQGTYASHEGPVVGPGDDGISWASGGTGGKGGVWGAGATAGSQGSCGGKIDSWSQNWNQTAPAKVAVVQLFSGGSITWIKKGDYRGA